jgi:outer membrane protein
VARSNSNTAVANAYIAKARVLAAAGALEQSWLMPENARYDPEQHWRKVRHNGDIPIATPILRAIDGAPLFGGTRARAVRDPAGKRTAAPIIIQPAETLAGTASASPVPASPPASPAAPK